MNTTDDLQSLRVKSYFAASFQEAMEQARKEMGQDALLLNSREAPPEARHLGAFEVVFGNTTEPEAVPDPASSSKPSEDLLQELRDIHSLLARMIANPFSVKRNRFSAIEETLIEAGVDAALAQDIKQSVLERMGQRSVVEIGKPRATADWRIDDLLIEGADEVANRFAVDSTLGRIAALVGPPGCGKTTTLIKLALKEGLMAGRPVRLLFAGSDKIGAAEQLRMYSTILGTSFQAVEDAASLSQAVDSAPENELVLIDTAGLNASGQQKTGSDIAALLSDSQRFDVHLVLTASMRSADMARIAEGFAAFNPSKLLFTKIDETDSLASVFCEVVRQGRPLSFFTNGQMIPEDIAPVSKEQIARSLVGKLPEYLKLVA
jgi:flagellar biosynthesis protein FlhF